MLKERLKFILKDTVLYGLANAISKLFQFLTIPILTANINPEEFGLWSLFFLYGNIFAAILIFGMDSAVVRYFYDSEEHPYKQKVFSSGLSFQLITSILFLVIIFLSFKNLASNFDIKQVYHNEFLLVLLWVPTLVIFQYIQNWFKWTFQRLPFLFMTVGFTLLNLLLLYYFLSILKKPFIVVFQITFGSQLIMACIGLLLCRKYFILTFDKQLIKKLIYFGFPMMLVMLLSLLSTSLDRLFLIDYINTYEFGIYSFYQKLSILMAVLVTAFQTAFGPFVFSIWDKDQARETFAHLQSYYIIVTCLAGIFISSFATFFVSLLASEEYFGFEGILSILVTGLLFYGLYSFAVIGIYYSKKTLLNLLCLLGNVSVNLLFCIALVPYLLQYGVALAFAFGNIALIGVGYYFSNKYYKIDFYIKNNLYLLLFYLLLLSINSLINLEISPFFSGMIRAICFCSIFLLFVFFTLAKTEKSYIKQFFQKFYKKSSVKV